MCDIISLLIGNPSAAEKRSLHFDHIKTIVGQHPRIMDDSIILQIMVWLVRVSSAGRVSSSLVSGNPIAFSSRDP